MLKFSPQSFRQKMKAFVALFILAAAIPLFAYIREELKRLHAIDIQIAGNQFERPLRELLEYLPEHDLASQKFLKGDTSIKGDLNNLEAKISEQFRRLASLGVHYDSPIALSQADLSSPDALIKDWEALKRQGLDLTPAGNGAAHKELILHTKDLVSLIGDSSRHALEGDMGAYYAMEATLNDLPEVQQQLGRIITLSDDAIRKGKLGDEERGALIESLALLQSSIDSSELRIGKVYKADLQRGLNQNLFRLFNQYINALEGLIFTVKSQVLEPSSPATTMGHFFEVASDAKSTSFLFWDQAVDSLDETLREKKKGIERSLFLVGISSLLLVVLSSIFVSRLTHRLINDLKSCRTEDLQTRTRLEILNEKIHSIKSLLETITKISDQTNLLSLNASIEAEKAEAHGKSFGFIAREIKRHADLTVFTTLDIEKALGEALILAKKVHEGIEEMEKRGKKLDSIISSGFSKI